MTNLRDCFNTDRNNDDSAEMLIAHADVASYAAGYDRAEYLAWLDTAIAALSNRATEVRKDITGCDC